MQDTNRTVLVGRLTRDPELRYTDSGTPVTTLRVAFTTRRKTDGEWQDKPNYIDVNVFGVQAENAVEYLTKGRQVAIDGRIEWREFEGQDGARRQAISINAGSLQFLGSGDRENGPTGSEAGTKRVTTATVAGSDGLPF